MSLLNFTMETNKDSSNGQLGKPEANATQLITITQSLSNSFYTNKEPIKKRIYSADHQWPNKLAVIREKQMFGSLIEATIKSNHPLISYSKPQHDILSNPTKFRMKLGSASDKSNDLHNSSSTSDADRKNKLRFVAKSARELMLPHFNAIDRKKQALANIIKPKPHRPWKLYRVISGSGGWIHCVAVEPANEWFASGSADGIIRIYNLARGTLRLSLTGHISGVRGLAISRLRPYMFSCAEDKAVKCWDLEQNHIVRHYHGHLSGVYCIALHSQDNQLITGGRDSVARLWDVRTKEQVACMTGHKSTVSSILCQKLRPQFITASHDSTVRLWDLRNLAHSILTLTHHRKAIRALAFDNEHDGFLSASADNIKQWTLPDGDFVQNFSGHEAIINALAMNENNVAVSGGNDGYIKFWDWKTGKIVQEIRCPPQPGSIESEAGIQALAFDMSSSRLITGESDKTIKMFRETDIAIEQKKN